MLGGLRFWAVLLAKSREKFGHTWLAKNSFSCEYLLLSFRQYAEVYFLGIILHSSLWFLCGDNDFWAVITEGQIARHYYEGLRRKAASLTIQTYYRMHFARKHYRDLCCASTTIQSVLRGMAARKELHFRQQTKAAVIIQVCFQVSFYVFSHPWNAWETRCAE